MYRFLVLCDVGCCPVEPWRTKCVGRLSGMTSLVKELMGLHRPLHGRSPAARCNCGGHRSAPGRARAEDRGPSQPAPARPGKAPAVPAGLYFEASLVCNCDGSYDFARNVCRNNSWRMAEVTTLPEPMMKPSPMLTYWFVSSTARSRAAISSGDKPLYIFRFGFERIGHCDIYSDTSGTTRWQPDCRKKQPASKTAKTTKDKDGAAPNKQHITTEDGHKAFARPWPSTPRRRPSRQVTALLWRLRRVRACGEVKAQAYVKEFSQTAVERAEVKAEYVERRLNDMLMADPRDLVEVYISSCRHCHGLPHGTGAPDGPCARRAHGGRP